MEQAVKQRIADIQRGNVPAGYRKTKLGIIPADWQEVCFGNILHNEVRKVAKPQTAYWRLGIRSHAKGTFREFVEDPTTVNMDELYSVQTNDLVVNITFAWEHAIAIVKEEDSGLLVSHRFPTYVFNENASADFYKYIITLKWVKEQLDLISPGGAGRNRVMNKNAFLKMPCYTLPLEEQRRIAEILGCCDRVIALKKELIAEKKKHKKALMQKLLNPDSGFRLPVIREKITQVHFNDICRFINGRAYSQDELLETGKYRVLRVGNLFTSDTWYFSNLELPNDKYCQKDDLLYAWSASFGPFIWQGETTIYHYHIWKVEPCEHVDKMFLYHCLKYDAELLENSIQGGTMSHITKETMERRLCPFVDNLDLQKNIADILSAADKEIDLLEQELDQQEQKKKSLMQLLLTGIVRV